LAHARQRQRALRAALRFLAAVLITTGLLTLADAALTLTWQEPISALLAELNQNRLGGELDTQGRLFADQERGLIQGSVDQRISELAKLWARRARRGHPIGRIYLPTLHRRYVVVHGTDEASLEDGPGHYPATTFPGAGGTVAIAGHRTTYLAPFRTINELKPGARIVLEMPYGRLTYAVEKTQVVLPTALWITNRVPGAERLVLSACTPLYSASHRIVAFARLVNESL
jgi:sortase A